MKIRDLFARKRELDTTGQPASSEAAAVRINLDLLDECVGGQAETEGVDCYVRSTQPRVH